MLTETWSLTGAASYIQAELSQDYFKSAGLAAPTAASGTPVASRARGKVEFVDTIRLQHRVVYASKLHLYGLIV